MRGDARPLHVRAAEILTGRIAAGTYAPGALIPSEPALAAELGMSAGTVRKALAELERRHLITRRQGRGTYVAAQTSARALFHFFRVVDLEGIKAAPTSYVLDCRTGAATAAEAGLLALPRGAPVHRIRRGRAIGPHGCIVERITLPAARFPGFSLPVLREMDDELYVLYQRGYGVTIARAEERLAAMAAEEEDAVLLNLPAGAPVLEIARIAYDLEDRPVERRVTILDTARHRYAAELS